MELEGLRGLAAIAVVVWHYFYAFYPALTTGNMSLQHMRFEDNIYGTPLAVGFYGTLAVAIFFVLSGFVLTIGFFQTKRADIIKKLASKRYLRLMLPALASILIALLFIKLNIASIDEAAAITKSSWLEGSWSFDSGLVHAFLHGTIGIFTEGGSPYNNVLWTMTTEFLGSFMVFAFVLFFAQSKYRWLGYIVMAVLTFNTWYVAFVVGMVIADLYAAGVLEKLRNRYMVLVLLVAGLLIGAYPSHPQGTMYEVLRFSWLDGIDLKVLYLTLGSAMIVLAVIMGKKLASLLARPKVSILGKYTFSLYLTHLAVLYVFTTGIFVRLEPTLGYNKAFIASMLLSVPVLYLAAKLFEKYIDSPSIAFAKWCAEIYDGKREFDWRQQVVVVTETVRLRWVIARGRMASLVRQQEDLSE